MRAIAIDYGEKRCGIAIEIENIAIPKEIIPQNKILEILIKYLNNNNDIKIIIVGLPYDLYKSNLEQLNKTKKFIEKLKNTFGEKYKIIGIDERFSSIQAKNILSQMGIKKQKIKKDAISASIILETYLNNKKKYV